VAPRENGPVSSKDLQADRWGRNYQAAREGESGEDFREAMRQ